MPLDLNVACKSVIKCLRYSAFFGEISLLKQQKQLSTSNKLISMLIVLDADKLLWVGGCASIHEILSFYSKHPILIPKNNHLLTEAIIRYFHLCSLHAGPAQNFSLIRQKLWIPNGRSVVKKGLRKCIRCIRMSA